MQVLILFIVGGFECSLEVIIVRICDIIESRVHFPISQRLEKSLVG